MSAMRLAICAGLLPSARYQTATMLSIPKIALVTTWSAVRNVPTS
ncbi:Uncharacterised protein [Mycobacteroides abscessus subsp. abscessus]|nr:Uncharacterised protein [Mycobacteroides abscessus subsp. abscessus]